MARVRPRRRVEDCPEGAGRGTLAALKRRLGDLLLWALGTMGLVSLVAAAAAYLGGFSVVLFSTGSMSPAIPAGSAALVRLVPASDLAVGDVVTVQRPGRLPITHRITSIAPLVGSESARVVTLRGDANQADDPEPYVISDARVVIASWAGASNWVAGLRDPRLMGLLALLAGGLVTFAFWPRRAAATTLLAAAVVVGSQVLGAPEARAVETEHQVVGTHLVLTVISDEEALASMVPGRPVLWQVGIATKGDEEGAVHVGLGLAAGSVAADAMTVDVLACAERWQGETCPVAAESWVTGARLDQAFLPATHGDTRELGMTAAGEPLWVLVRAVLDRHDVNLKATLKVGAWGAGEMVSAESDGGHGRGSQAGLASTGPAALSSTLAVAGVAIGTGLVVARLAGTRRRDADREVAR